MLEKLKPLTAVSDRSVLKGVAVSMMMALKAYALSIPVSALVIAQAVKHVSMGAASSPSPLA